MGLPSEKALIKAIGKDDADAIASAFEPFYKDTNRLVAFLIAQYVDGEEDIKDLVEEAYIELFSHLRDVSSPKQYLCQIARSLAISHLRKKKDIEPLPEGDYAPTEHSQTQYALLLSDMGTCMDAEEISIVLLHVVEGYSFQEIGDMKKMRENTVKTKYHRALHRFQSRKEFHS